MNKLFFRIFLVLLVSLAAPSFVSAQGQPDSNAAVKKAVSRADTTRITKIDSTQLKRDTTSAAVKDSLPLPKPKPDTTLQWFYGINPYVNTKAQLEYRSSQLFSPKEKDFVFYILVGLLFVLGFIRLVFTKYFGDLFRIFFQTTFRQKSIREQLLQNRAASLVLNIFFCISGGLFLYFVAGYKGWLQDNGLIQKALFCMGLVAAVYSVKYITLQIIGWLFGMKDVTETYLFIVFLINKVVGILLLPPIAVLALGNPALQSILLVISLLILGILYLYRYLIALPLVRNHSGLTGFHFFIYLCAFEIIPVMIIYKLLLLILNR